MRKNQLIYSIIILVLFVLPAFVVAQQYQSQIGQANTVESETSETGAAQVYDVDTDELKLTSTPGDLGIYDTREVETKATNPAMLREKLKNRLETIVEKQLEFKERLQEKQAMQKQVLEQKRSQFQAQIKTIKDEQKQKILTRIEERLNEINIRLVEHLMTQVDKLQNYLNRLTTVAQALTEKDVKAGDIIAQIETIQDQLDSYKINLTAQVEKDYVPELTIEANLKQDVGESHQALRADFKMLRNSLMEIQQQILAVLKSLISL